MEVSQSPRGGVQIGGGGGGVGVGLVVVHGFGFFTSYEGGGGGIDFTWWDGGGGGLGCRPLGIAVPLAIMIMQLDMTRKRRAMGRRG